MKNTKDGTTGRTAQPGGVIDPVAPRVPGAHTTLAVCPHCAFPGCEVQQEGDGSCQAECPECSALFFPEKRASVARGVAESILSKRSRLRRRVIEAEGDNDAARHRLFSRLTT